MRVSVLKNNGCLVKTGWNRKVCQQTKKSRNTAYGGSIAQKEIKLNKNGYQSDGGGGGGVGYVGNYLCFFQYI